MSFVTPLYPAPGPPRSANGLYLEQRLHRLGTAQSPFVYGSFVQSLDGRISVGDPGARSPLEGLSSRTDFRLFQELQAQADCLITHAGYLRALAQGRLGNVLQINASGEAPDLIDWRKQHGLAEQPAIVVASASLDFAVPASIREHGQTIHVATGRGADSSRVEALRRQGYRVIMAGLGAMVDGAPLVRELSELGYRSLYLLAGPKMLGTMLRDGKLSRLYLTIRHRLLGGQSFNTMIEGPPLGGAGELRLQAMCYEPGEAQWFAELEPSASTD